MKELTCPEEIVNMFAEANGYEELIPVLAKLPFTFKRLLKVAKMSNILRSKAWRMLGELYPEIKRGNWSLEVNRGIVTQKGEQKL